MHLATWFCSTLSTFSKLVPVIHVVILSDQSRSGLSSQRQPVRRTKTKTLLHPNCQLCRWVNGITVPQVLSPEVEVGYVQILDENSPFLCKQLRQLGCSVLRICIVPDDVRAIAAQVNPPPLNPPPQSFNPPRSPT